MLAPARALAIADAQAVRLRRSVQRVLRLALGEPAGGDPMASVQAARFRAALRLHSRRPPPALGYQASQCMNFSMGSR